MHKDIYELCLAEKTLYETRGVPVAGDWQWSMYNHCNYSLLMKNGQFPITQTKMGDKPMKNIIRPILNVAYRSEGFDVKDIEPYVNDDDKYYMTLLVRKFHDKWARENDLDTFIDEVVETYVDYGGVLVKNVNKTRPEVVSWQQVAFCDQTDILSGTLGLKHQFSIDQLKNTIKDFGWYKTEVDRAITFARVEKSNDQSFGNQQKTPGKYIEVYEVHGTFPTSWLKKEGAEAYNATLSADDYSSQIHIITFTEDKDGKASGICLFKGEEKESIFKLLLRDKIYGRALGFGGVEELFEPQIWTNFSMIHMMNMLKEASKIIHITTDPSFTTKNNTKNAQGGEVFEIEDGKTIEQLNVTPVNINLFDRVVQEQELHARTTGSANDAQLGLNPPSGTPFSLQNLVVSTGQGIHEYRRGKIATFMAEIYRDWILDYLVAEMSNGDKWMAELTLQELQEVAENISVQVSNETIKQMVLSGKMVTPQEQDTMRQSLKQAFFKKGNKHFLEIVKGEFKKIPVDVFVNIANKQKDLGKTVEKLTNIFKVIFANPQGFIETMKIPGAAESFNQSLEDSGLKQMNFGALLSAPSAPLQAQPSPIRPQTNQTQLAINT